MITDRIEAWAREQPEKAALIHNGAIITYAALVRRMQATRRFLESHSPPVGGTAVVLVHNLADALVVLLALRNLGLDTVCVNSIAGAEALQLKNVACVVMTRPELDHHALTGRAFAGVKGLVVPAQSLYAQDGFDEAPEQPTRPPFGGHILYTSGTTGSPKKVYCDPMLELARLERIAATRGNTRQTVNSAGQFPLWTAIGYGQTLSVLNAGGTNIIVQKPQLTSDFFRHGANKAIVIPVLARRLVELCKAAGERPEALDLSVSGGFCPMSLIEDLYRYVTTNVWIAYGSTECPTVARIRYDPGETPHWMNVVSDRIVEMVDDNDRVLPLGHEGRLRVRLLEHDIHRYIDDQQATDEHFRDGSFYPGDLAVRRGDGRLRIVGREGDVLNVQGHKVAAAPLELQVQSLLGVDNACLFSGLDRKGAEELVVAIEAPRLPARSALEQVARLFAPFDSVRFECMAQFPRTTAGMSKIKRAELRRMVFPS